MLHMQTTPCNSFLSLFFSGDLERRDLSHKEKLYLRELNVITETQCTLGNRRSRELWEPSAFEVVLDECLSFS